MAAKSSMVVEISAGKALTACVRGLTAAARLVNLIPDKHAAKRERLRRTLLHSLTKLKEVDGVAALPEQRRKA
jgi:hypothetical protein